MIRLERERLLELWRYYQVGIVNTIFGYGMYALFIRLGLNMYVAQLAAHLLGMAFNYFSYSRHVFRDSGPAKARFIGSYIGNYLLGLAVLLVLGQIIRSPYLAGLVGIVITSIINYFVLKYFVFVRSPA